MQFSQLMQKETKPRERDQGELAVAIDKGMVLVWMGEGQVCLHFTLYSTAHT